MHTLVMVRVLKGFVVCPKLSLPGLPTMESGTDSLQGVLRWHLLYLGSHMTQMPLVQAVTGRGSRVGSQVLQLLLFPCMPELAFLPSNRCANKAAYSTPMPCSHVAGTL